MLMIVINYYFITVIALYHTTISEGDLPKNFTIHEETKNCYENGWSDFYTKNTRFCS